jgi:hypothetical protein
MPIHMQAEWDGAIAGAGSRRKSPHDELIDPEIHPCHGRVRLQPSAACLIPGPSRSVKADNCLGGTPRSLGDMERIAKARRAPSWNLDLNPGRVGRCLEHRAGECLRPSYTRFYLLILGF